MARMNSRKQNRRTLPSRILTKKCSYTILGLSREMKHPLLSAVSILAICLGSAAQTSTVEYEVKGAFLLNFAKFVDWPPQAFAGAGDPFTFCIAGDAFAGALEKVLNAETLNGRRLVVRRIAPADKLQGCQIIYVAASASGQYSQITTLGNAPILTVGETEDFIDSGGMIRFIETGHRIQFQINAAAAERASLKLSSKLLRLAEIVRPKGKG